MSDLSSNKRLNFYKYLKPLDKFVYINLLCVFLLVALISSYLAIYALIHSTKPSGYVYFSPIILVALAQSLASLQKKGLLNGCAKENITSKNTEIIKQIQYNNTHLETLGNSKKTILSAYLTVILANIILLLLLSYLLRLV